MAQDSGKPKFPAPIPNPLGDDEKTDPNLTIPSQRGEEKTSSDLKRPSNPVTRRQTQSGPSPSTRRTPLAQATTTDTPIPPTPPPAPIRMPDLGLLEPLMKDQGISEIMVNDIRNVMIEKDGKMTFAGFAYPSIEELNRLIRNILDITGRILSPESPYVDTMLPDGSRVNIVGPPLTVQGPSITIRKFPTKSITVHDLMKSEFLDQRMAYFLNVCVVGRLNILICGGTGGGKTTLLNVLTSFIPKNERLVTIEDTPELSVQHYNSIRLQTKPQTPTSAPVTARDLVANSLRMRPDRVIVGECRRSEAFDMLQAMNTGHSGSMTTLHANSPRDGLARLETLCLLAGVDLPLSAIRKQMASALDLIIQIHRFRNGKRRIVLISEVTGTEGDVITLQDIFQFETETEKFKVTGLVPTFLSRLKEQGIELPSNYFF
jgi:pilus assembly protein CpaF